MPASAASGVPASRPLVELKLAQGGFPEIANVIAAPSGSLAVGVKVYGLPSTTVDAGVPDIDGGWFTVAAVTVIEIGARLALSVPSVTLITMLLGHAFQHPAVTYLVHLAPETSASMVAL